MPTLPGIETIDSLSAGDVFHGVFALELAAVRNADDIADADVFAAARTASAAAALKCAVFGGRLGTPLRAATDAARPEVLPGVHLIPHGLSKLQGEPISADDAARRAVCSI